MFHMHCIVQWLEIESSRNLCPMCRRVFEAKNEEAECCEGEPGETSTASGAAGDVDMGGEALAGGVDMSSEVLAADV